MVKSVWHWFSHRPFFSAVAVTVVLLVPGYYRQETAIDDAHDAADDAHDAADKAKTTADRLADVVQQFEQDRMDRRHELCERDVADQDSLRAFWLFVLDDLLDPTDRDVARARAALDEIHPVLECNAEDLAVPVGGP